MNDLRVSLFHQRAEGAHLPAPTSPIPNGVDRHAKRPDLTHVQVVLAIVPDDDGRPVPIAIHRLKQVEQLPLQPAGTQLAHEVQETTLHWLHRPQRTSVTRL